MKISANKKGVITIQYLNPGDLRFMAHIMRLGAVVNSELSAYEADYRRVNMARRLATVLLDGAGLWDGYITCTNGNSDPDVSYIDHRYYAGGVSNAEVLRLANEAAAP